MKLLIVLFFSLSMLNLPMAFAAAGNRKGSAKGWRESYGGDYHVAEFKTLGRQLGHSLSSQDFELLSGVDKELFEQTVINVQIECKSNLKLDNVTKWAINYPFEKPQRIELDCQKWANETSFVGKSRLVAHEFLHLAFIDDSTYEISEKLISRFLMENKKNEDATNRAFDAALFCYVKKFNQAVADGANIYSFSLESGANLVNVSVAGGCLNVLKELERLGVNISEEPTLLPSLFYFLRTKSYTDANKSKEASELLAFLAEKTSIKTASLTDTEIKLPFDPYNQVGISYPLSEECSKGSTLSTLMAKDITAFSVEKRRTGDQQIMNAKLEILNSLQSSGFNTTGQNECGESMENILRRVYQSF